MFADAGSGPVVETSNVPVWFVNCLFRRGDRKDSINV